jgi:hypothetical protein
MRKLKRHKDGVLRIIDHNMKWQGDTDLKRKVVRINPTKSKKKSGKGGVIDTIVHEEYHIAHPKATEKETYAAVPKILARMTAEQKQKLYARYKRKR